MRIRTMSTNQISKRLFPKVALTLTLALLTVATAWAETTMDNVSYIDANGKETTVSQATVVTTDMGGTSSPNFSSMNGWFYVNDNVTLEGAYNRSTTAQNIILGDGATLTVSGRFMFNYASLNIYCQNGGTGKLVVVGGAYYNYLLMINSAQTLTLYGGTVEVTNMSDGGVAFGGNLVMNGGTASFTSKDYAISRSVTLNDGTFTATVGSEVGVCDGTMTIGDGKYFKDGSGSSYIGTLTDQQKKDINGKTLTLATYTDYIHSFFGVDNDGSTDHPYTISSVEGWDAFCLALEDKTEWNGFSGKTVKLDADIEVSRMAGSGSGDNLTESDHPFCGTFDGGGKTLTFNYGSSDNPADENYLAPFRYVNNATIEHLHVDGDIYTQHVHASGIIGMAYGTTNVTDCRSSVNIISSINGDGTHGGIMSSSWTGSTTNITGCLFDGSIQSADGYSTDQCGGFVGLRNATINVTNCLLTADLSTIAVGTGSYPSATFVRHGDANTITNSYYTAALGTIQGKQRHSITAGDYVTVAFSGEATRYTTSGITAYKDGNETQLPGLLHNNNVLYAGQGDQVSLTLGNTLPTSYTFDYNVSPDEATLTGSGDAYSLIMPAADVTMTITATADPDFSANEAGTEYTINNDSGWNKFCNYLDDGETFSGKIVKLGAGITVTRMAGSEDKYFCGTFDGQGNTLDVNYDAAENFCAPFRYVGGTSIIKRLHVDGTITTESMYGCGLVGMVIVDGSVTVEDCRISVSIESSYSGTGRHAGVVARGKMGATINITGCVFDGSIRAKYSTACGGFFGSAQDATTNCTIKNSLFAPTRIFVKPSSENHKTFARGTNYTIINSYYTETLGTAQGTMAYSMDAAPANLGAQVTGVDYTMLTAYENGILTDGKYYVAPATVSLADNAANDIAAINGYFANVTLNGRTLWMDGAWNTLCLPFEVTITGSVLDGDGVQAMTLNTETSNLTDGTLTLNFTDATTIPIPAGTPFIIKWDEGTMHILNPQFNSVIVSNATNNATTRDNSLTFIGTYAPTDIYSADMVNLYLGAGNTLYYPWGEGMTSFNVNAFRAYFHLNDASETNVRSIVLNFEGGESTGVKELKNSITEELKSENEWYDLHGRKLNGKPTHPGIYLQGNRKVIIK